MALTTVRVGFGAEAQAWLGTAVRAAAGANLDAVTVIMSGAHQALAARRDLVADGPLANVRVLTLGRLAEQLGAGRLAAAGGIPVRAATDDAAIRRAAAAAPPPLCEIRHPSLGAALRTAFAHIRRDEASLPRLRSSGGLAGAVAAAYTGYRDLLARGRRYDATDLLEAAAASIREGGVEMSEVGTVLVHLPMRLSAAEAGVILALAERTDVAVSLGQAGDAVADAAGQDVARRLVVDWAALPVAAAAQTGARAAGGSSQVLLAPTAAEEVRAAVRTLLAALEANDPVRSGIAYAVSDPYQGLIVDTLRAAGVSPVMVDGRPLAETHAGRALLMLLNLPGADFARAAVMEFLSAAPRNAPGEQPAAQWDRLSRRAGVVRGLAQWRERLAALRVELADGGRHGLSEAAAASHRRDIDRATAMEEWIVGLAAALRPPGSGWPELAAWSGELLARFIPVPGWPVAEQEAAQLVGEELNAIADAAAFEDSVPPDVFLHALEQRLRSRRIPTGRLGTGVLVGSLAGLAAMPLDHLCVVGLVEGVCPSAVPPDPLIPTTPGIDPFERRDRRLAEERTVWLRVLGSARTRLLLSLPLWESDQRPVHPSPWLVEHASGLEGRALTGSDLRGLDARPWLLRVNSPEEAVRGGGAVNLAEYRLAEAIAERGRGGLAASALAVRLPELARQLTVRAARDSEALTEFDGDLSSVADHPRLVRGLAGEPTSATTVEAWAACPFRYLMKTVLRVEPTERPESDERWEMAPHRRGTLVHEILERFFSRRDSARQMARAPYTEADRDRLVAIAEDCFTAAEHAGITGHPLIWRNDRTVILTDLLTLLHHDDDLFGSLVPRFFEQPFGYDDPAWPAVELPLDGGRTVRLHGYIDRIDLGPDPVAPSRGVVIDYKTGGPNGIPAARELAADPVIAGTRLQLAVYSLALIEAMRHQGTPLASAEARYWYITGRAAFATACVDDPVAAGRRLTAVLRTIDEGVRTGAFPQVPGPEELTPRRPAGTWTNCEYCAFDRLCPSGRHVVQARKAHSAGSRVHASLSLSPSGEDLDD